MESLARSNKTIAVAYLARGADKNWFVSFERFLDSYITNHPGISHNLYVIFKGFEHDTDLKKSKLLFSKIPHNPIFLGDQNFDIGAYIEWANMIEEDLICVLNTASEILSLDWLRKLYINLTLPNVGLVGATGSYESINQFNNSFPLFPNLHIRSTGFMIDRKFFLKITDGLKIITKVDAFHFESGPKSLTRQVMASGKEIFLIGRNGRSYSPKFWASSNTFRQGTQNNLLIADNQTRNFSALPWVAKREFVNRTWGEFIKGSQMLKLEI
jgi:hypothetical protein